MPPVLLGWLYRCDALPPFAAGKAPSCCPEETGGWHFGGSLLPQETSLCPPAAKDPCLSPPALPQCPFGLPDCSQLLRLAARALQEEVEVLLGKSWVSIGRVGLETGRGILACSCRGLGVATSKRLHSMLPVNKECPLHTLPWPAVALQNWPQVSDPMILEGWEQRTNISWEAKSSLSWFYELVGGSSAITSCKARTPDSLFESSWLCLLGQNKPSGSTS